MAVGDRYVLTLTANMLGSLGANPLNNVFAYESGSSGSSAEDLIAGFGVDVLPDIQEVLSDQTVFSQIEVYNLDNVADFAIDALSSTGNTGGERMPVFTAWAFEYVRAVRGIHNGRKSFGVMPESFVVGDSPSAGAAAALAVLAGSLEAPIIGVTGNEYTPKIWRREGIYGSPPTAFPDTFYPISAVQFTRLSTQNTRKR